MEQILEVKSIEQAKVLAHKLRMTIISLFDDEVARTSKQLADELELPPSKVHYHVRELQRVGILELVETREKGGVLEKYYLPVAKEIRIRLEENEPAHSSGKSGNYITAKAIIDEYKDSFLKAIETAEQQNKDSEKKNQQRNNLTAGSLELSPDEYQQFSSELLELYRKWDTISNNKKEGSQSVRFLFSLHRNKPNK